MQRKSFWFVLGLLCLAGAAYFWRANDHRQAMEPSEPPAAVKTVSKQANVLKAPPRSSVIPALLTTLTNRASAVSNKIAAIKVRYPYRLTNTDESLDKLIHNDHGILLANALLDTSKTMNLAIPDRLRAPADNGSYLVQARGPLDAAFRASLREANASIVSYIPNNAYLVRVSAAGAQQLSANAQTQSVLPYEPYYKLEPSLLQMAMEQPDALPQNGALNVTVFGDAHDAVLQALQKMGTEVAGEDRSPFGPVLKVYAAPGTLSAVASLPGVQGVAAWHARVAANDLTRPRLGISTDSVVPDTYLGLTGSNVLININDFGFDAGHPDLTNRLTNLPDEAFIFTDPSGHGTHVAGTILGNGSQSTTVSNVPSGSVTNANFRGMAPDATAFVLSADDPDSFLQEQAAAVKAFISNNSWNYGGDSTYDIAAASYDAAVRDALPEITGPQPLLYVFSAGNSGGGDDNGTGLMDTILSPATAKNVISVGSIEQPRFITNEVVIGNETNVLFYTETDSDNQVSSFSSRGNVGFYSEGTAGRFKPDVVTPGSFVISDRSGQWDTAAYYDPTNNAVNLFPNETVETNALTSVITFNVPLNAVQITFTVETNQFSPNPMPPMPIYVRKGAQPTLTTYDLLGTNSVSLPTNGLDLTPGTSYSFSVGNAYSNAVSFNALLTLATTNDNGYYISLSNLNNGLAPYYRYESGTSMSAANVSGLLACVQEFFQKLKLTNSPALMKALLINGSRTIGQQYDFNVSAPNGNSQGWGLPNLQNIIPAAFANLTPDNISASVTNVPLLFIDQSPTNVLATGQSKTRTLALSPDAEFQDLRVTLVWTDPPGNPAAGTKLVNDLDLIVSNTVTHDVFYGNDIPFGSVYSESYFPGDPPIIDSVNNVENVFLQAPIDTNYIITVLGRRVNVNAVTSNTNDIVQDYALVISSGDVDGIANPFVSLTDSPGASNTPAATNVYFVTNAVPLFNQRVGANAQYTPTTNGSAPQWNFYVYTNTPSLTNANYTNVAFLTFLPPNLGVPRMGASVETGPPDTNATRFNGADVDLYVSTNPGLTNLDQAVLAAAYKSTTRSGTEKVLLTNSPAGQVYYIGVKSEDQQGAQYDFFAAATELPFDQTDSNGNTIVTIITPMPVPIVPGGPQNPNHALILGVSTATTQIRKAIVTDTIFHSEFGDLIGTLTHERETAGKVAVLNNHSFFNNTNDPGETFIYDDSGENEFPTARLSDGPGSLRDFTGDTPVDGIWMFTMVNDNSTFDIGSISNFMITLEPQPPTNGYFRTIPANSWYYDFVDVPANATNLTVSVGTSNGVVDLYLKRGNYPSMSSYDKSAIISPPGSQLSISKFDSPPLNAGVYYFGIYNPNLTPITVFITVTVQLSVNPAMQYKFDSVGNEPLLDDAVTYSTNHVDISSAIVSANVGVRIDHPRESDLVLTLISPLGTRILLAENRGGNDTNGYGSGINVTNVLPQTTAGDNGTATNVIPITQDQGTLVINYDFEQVKDDMRVYYGSELIFDSGLINGTGHFSVDFGPGSATSLQIIMNAPGTNPTATNGDVWQYTATVITKKLTYATFTEDTNLTSLPIKFAVPPFGSNKPGIPATNILNSGFEGVPVGDYAVPSLVDGWLSTSTNPVKVVTVTALADTGTNVLALHNGEISRVLPTVAGESYTLTFVSHGRPSLSPTSWWKAEDTSGIASDSAGANNGLYQNGALSVPGLVGNAFGLNGAGQHIRVADSPSLRFSNSMTAEAWIYPTNLSASGVYDILVKYDAPGFYPGQSAYGMGLTFPPSYVAYMIVNTATASQQVITSSLIPQNQWSHIAATYDSTGLKMYFNGILQQTTPFIGNLFPGTDALAIGGNVGGEPVGGVGVPFIGLIDEPTVYSNALSILQIQDIYAAGSAGKDYPVGTVPLVSAQIIIGTALSNVINFITAKDVWQTNSYTFTAPSNNVPLTIISRQDGMLLDSFNLVRNASANPTNYYLPEEPMDKLVGQNALGDWKLEVLDNRAGATNPQPMLVSWELNFVLADNEPLAIPLLHAISQTNSVAPGQITYFLVDVPAWAKFATNSLITTSGGTVNLLFNQNVLPMDGNPPSFQLLSGVGTTVQSALLSDTLPPSTPPLFAGQRYYLGVQNTGATLVDFSIEVDFDITTLSNAVATNSIIAVGNVPQYYQFDVHSNAIAASFELLNPSGPVSMYIKKGPPLPDPGTFDYYAGGTISQTVIVLTNTTPVPVGPGRWYIGTFNNGLANATYGIRATEAFAPTIIPLTNGVPFNFNSPPGPALTNFFSFTILTNTIPSNTPTAVLFELYNLSGNVDLNLDREQLPYVMPFFAFSDNPGTNREQIAIYTNASTITNIVGNWFLGVPNNDSGNVTYTIRAVVSTNGLLVSGVPIRVIVTLPPPGSPNGPTLTFPAVTGQEYVLQYTTDLVNWIDIPPPFFATSGTATVTDPNPVGGTRFYRVIQIPQP